MNVIKKLWNKHYYAICFFAFLMIYSVVVSGKCQFWKVSELSLSFHAVDFSVGFCSKILPGAIYSIFFDEVDILKVSVYETILLIILFIAVCIFIERFLLQTPVQYRKTGVIIAMFFLTGPITFSNYVIQLGMLDVYWVFLIALFLLFLTKKELYIFLIPVSLMAIAINFSSIVCFVPFFAILILYKLSCAENKKDKRFLCVIFFAMTVLSILLTVYFAMFETTNLTYTLAEFDDVLRSKGVPETHLYYYEYAFYGEGSGFVDAGSSSQETVMEVTANDSAGLYLLQIIKNQLENTFALRRMQISQGFGIKFLFIIVLTVPVIMFIFKTLLKLIKTNKDNKIKVFSLLCMMIMAFVPVISGLLTSTDLIRWLSHSFFPLFVFFIYVLHCEGASIWEYVNKRLSGIPLSVLAPYFLIYAATTFDPYGL